MVPACNSRTSEVEAEGSVVKVIFRYMENLKLTWATKDPVSIFFFFLKKADSSLGSSQIKLKCRLEVSTNVCIYNTTPAGDGCREGVKIL